MAITDNREEIIKKRHYREDIKGDQYSLYLSNYPVSVKYLADRIGDSQKTYLELCCGVGITLSEMSLHFKKAIGIELDSQILEYCRENLSDLGVLDKVDLIQGDISDNSLITKTPADVVVYDIPYWVSKELPGGTNVLDKNPPFETVVRTILEKASPDLVVFAPNYFSTDDVRSISDHFEFQRVYVNDRYDRNYIYFGSLVKEEGITAVKLVN